MASTTSYKSAGEQLVELGANLDKKLDNVNGKIDADQAIRDSLVKEVKAGTAKLEKLDKRLSVIKGAYKEYAKTIGELDFALAKIEEAARGMEDKLASLSRLQNDI